MSAIDHLTVAELEQVLERARVKADAAKQAALNTLRDFAARPDLVDRLWDDVNGTLQTHIRKAWMEADEADADVSEFAIRLDKAAPNGEPRKHGRGTRYRDLDQ